MKPANLSELSEVLVFHFPPLEFARYGVVGIGPSCTALNNLRIVSSPAGFDICKH